MITVVGVGNLVRSDDGLGIQALWRLQRDPRVPDGIAFIDGSTRGIELVDDTAEAECVLVLDAIDVDATPGTLVSMSGEELSRLPGGWTVHHLGVVDWMTALLMLTGRLPEVRVLGLQPAETGWGTTLSAALQTGLDALIDAAVDQLRAWAVRDAGAGGDLRPRGLVAPIEAGPPACHGGRIGAGEE